MGWLIDLAEAAIPGAGATGKSLEGAPDHLPPLTPAADRQGAAPRQLPGVSPEFAARLDAEDLEDIAAGDISLGTVQAFEAAAIAREVEDLREAFEERAGILEYDAGLPRPEAELEAARITVTYARNRKYLWASLRAALADYPALLSQMPARPGKADTLPGPTQARRAQGPARGAGSTCTQAQAPGRAGSAAPPWGLHRTGPIL